MPRSGMRSDSEVLLYLDVRAALADEVPVYLSQNRDVLTEGHGGTLPNRFISRVCVKSKSGLELGRCPARRASTRPGGILEADDRPHVALDRLLRPKAGFLHCRCLQVLHPCGPLCCLCSHCRTLRPVCCHESRKPLSQLGPSGCRHH